jgi:hypothetical protein
MPRTADVVPHVRAFLVTAVAVSLVAAPLGVLWAYVVPHAGYVLDPNGQGALAGQDGEFMRADGWFLLMTAIVGLLTGVVAWWLTNGHEPAAVVGLAVGSIFASIAVARIGQQRTTARLHLSAIAHKLGASDPLHGHYPPLAHGVLFMWAFAALAVYALLSAIVVRR